MTLPSGQEAIDFAAMIVTLQRESNHEEVTRQVLAADPVLVALALAAAARMVAVGTTAEGFQQAIANVAQIPEDEP